MKNKNFNTIECLLEKRVDKCDPSSATLLVVGFESDLAKLNVMVLAASR